MPLDFKRHHSVTIGLCVACPTETFFSLGSVLELSSVWLSSASIELPSMPSILQILWRRKCEKSQRMRTLPSRDWEIGKLEGSLGGLGFGEHSWCVLSCCMYHTLLSSLLMCKRNLVQKGKFIFAVMWTRGNAEPRVTFGLNMKCFPPLTPLFPKAPSWMEKRDRRFSRGIWKWVLQMENHVIKEVNSPISYPLGTLRHKILHIYMSIIYYLHFYILFIFTQRPSYFIRIKDQFIQSLMEWYVRIQTATLRINKA